MVQTATAGIRQVSTLTTGGLANPLVSTAEAGSSFALAILALLVPVIAMGVIVLMLVFGVKKISSWRASRRAASA